jgi:glucoamylase
MVCALRKWECSFGLIAVAVVCSASLARATEVTITQAELNTWLSSESPKATQALLNNISAPGTARGSVIASPSQFNPNYYYHWVRDGSLVMQIMAGLYENATDAGLRATYFGYLTDFVNFSRGNQLTPNRSGGLGEPKFNVDGSAFDADWGRPQNDGPALRAITLIRLAKDLMAAGQKKYVTSVLYDSKLPTTAVIKSDLEFVASNWQQSCFDLWEEVRGQHFYTRMVQRKALLQGAALAEELNDGGAAAWYRLQASLLEGEIAKHWDADRGYLLVTLNRDGGMGGKGSGLDVAVILAALHGDAGDGFYDATNEQILASSVKIQQSFQKIFPINQIQGLGTAIGRYPEDTYDGYGSQNSLGNAWVLATNAFAELYFKAANLWEARGLIEITSVNAPFFQAVMGQSAAGLTPGTSLSASDPRFQATLNAVRLAGDDFLKRTRYHVNSDGSMSEQINRYTGYMQGAHDLTWNYASILTATAERALSISQK